MISDIAMLVIVSTTSLGGCFGFILYHLRRSRCTEIDCCCIRCIRDPMDNEEMQLDKFEQIAAPKFKKTTGSQNMYTTSDNDDMNDLEEDLAGVNNMKRIKLHADT